MSVCVIMKEDYSNFGKNTLIVLMQQIPILGSIIRDSRNLCSEEEYNKKIEVIESFLNENQTNVKKNLNILTKNTEIHKKLLSITEKKFIHLESTINEILGILASKNIEEKIDTIIGEL